MTKAPGGRKGKPRPGSGSSARGIVYGYLAAGVMVMVVLAVRSPGLQEWLLWSLAFLLPYVISFRCAIIYAYRRNLRALNWWIRPGTMEREYEGAAHVYAVVFGIGALAVTLLH